MHTTTVHALHLSLAAADTGTHHASATLVAAPAAEASGERPLPFIAAATCSGVGCDSPASCARPAASVTTPAMCAPVAPSAKPLPAQSNRASAGAADQAGWVDATAVAAMARRASGSGRGRDRVVPSRPGRVSAGSRVWGREDVAITNTRGGAVGVVDGVPMLLLPPDIQGTRDEAGGWGGAPAPPSSTPARNVSS